MNDPEPKLTSKALLVLYDSLTLEEQNSFNLALEDKIRRSQLRGLYVDEITQEFLCNDPWISKELRATSQDVLLKYVGKIGILLKRGKEMLFLVDTITGIKSVQIVCYEREGGPVDPWRRFDALELMAANIPIIRWYVSRLPGTDFEAIVVSEN